MEIKYSAPSLSVLNFVLSDTNKYNQLLEMSDDGRGGRHYQNDGVAVAAAGIENRKNLT